ncbi:Ig-like domain-containing protein [Microbulbifer halophilus]|uniref:Ig-like domain-containing protein n=1 Tax=Microbulbifer halophilus TaxID=453963 RepID=A0ABW5EAI5_9GAMM|nr:Ig-like domain-containing protein [Microbulbifer halophilus]MCW8125219.1 Ig-like domain-containing protein [Microbulbifer halophilus]
MKRERDFGWRWIIRAAALLSVFALSACDGSSHHDGGERTRLTGLSVTPDPAAARLGDSRQLRATATFNNGLQRDVTNFVVWSSSDPDIATVDSGLVQTRSRGTTTISARLNRQGGQPLTAQASFTVIAEDLETIEVTPSNPSLAMGFQRQFTATGIFGDGSEQDLTELVTWSSSDTEIATIGNEAGSKGLASGLAVGTTTIAASLGSISGDTTLTVTNAVLESIGVTPHNPTVAAGFDQQFTATGIFDDGTSQDLTTQVTWASSDEGVATISNDDDSEGLATAEAEGTTAISASIDSISGEAEMTVTEAELESLQVTPTNPSVAKGFDQQFTATGLFDDGTSLDLTTQVSWSSSSTSVATISNDSGSKGLATSVASGETTISASVDSVSGETTLTVTQAVLESIEVTPPNPSLPMDFELRFTAMGLFSDGTAQDLTEQVIWSSSDTGVATISNAQGSDGLAKADRKGNTIIRARYQDVGTQEVVGQTTLTVTTAELSRVEVTPANPSVAAGFEQQFTATGTFSDGTQLDVTEQATWTSSDDDIARISSTSPSQGLATTLVKGTATISALIVTEDNTKFGDTTLTVTDAELQSIEVSRFNPSVPLGLQYRFVATGVFSDGSTQDLTEAKQVIWSSSKTGVATISNAQGSDGLATTLAEGTAIIRALYTDVGTEIEGQATLTVTAAELQSIEIDAENSSLPQGLEQQYYATGFYSDGSSHRITDQVTWSSSNTGVATIRNDDGSHGWATTDSEGTTTIVALEPESEVSNDTTLTVTAAELETIEVTPPNPSVAVGLQQPFTATGIFSNGSTHDITGQVSWASSDEGVATVNHAPGFEGQATAQATGTAAISATMDSASGNQVSGEALLTVTDAELEAILVEPSDPSVALGLQLTFTATGSFSDGSTQDLTTQVDWSSSDTGVAVIGTDNVLDLQGKAIPRAAGTTTIAAREKNSGVSGNTTLTVTPATVQSITVTPENPSVSALFDQQFTATGQLSDGTTQDITGQVSWTSDTPDVATISNAPAGSEGLATTIDSGSTTIAADFMRQNGSVVSKSTTLTVTNTELQSIEVTPVNPSVEVREEQEFTAIGTFSNGTTLDLTDQVLWHTTDKDIADISNEDDSKGVATGVADGTVTINADVTFQDGTSVVSTDANLEVTTP